MTPGWVLLRRIAEKLKKDRYNNIIQHLKSHDALQPIVLEPKIVRSGMDARQRMS
jgi:hypothetical protein